MKKLIIMVLLVGGGALVAYRAYDAYRAKANTRDAGGGRGPGGGAAMRMPMVDAVRTSEGYLEDKVNLVGSLRPIAEVEVMSKIAGRIEQVLVDVGDPVRKGQLLAVVEGREIEQQIQEAEASLAISRASIRQREAELANFTRQVRRYRDLYEQDLISRQELDDVLTRQQASEALLELSKAQFRQAEASRNQFRIDLENTRSHAPMDGFVGRRLVHPGALVSGNTPILHILDLRTLRMVVNVVEKDIVRVRRDVEAEIRVDAFPARTFRGKVSRVSPIMDPATRTGGVEIYVSNDRLDLRAEMFARVTLDLGGQRKGILVPREALVYRGDQSGVFALNGNRVQFRPVQVGVTQQNAVEILEGVTLGEQVVSMGASLLKDGDEVRLRSDRPERPKATSERPGALGSM
jgi:RND family efflux transporter MFP subunit